MVTRVIVADDEALVRAGIRVILEACDDIEVVGEAADGPEAVDVVRSMAPDLALLDIRMPRLDGIEAARRIVAADQGCHVLMLTTYGNDEYVSEALRAGATGFLLKASPPDEIVAAVRAGARGDTQLAPDILHRLVDDWLSRPRQVDEPPPVLSELTERETEVLRLIGSGLSNREIAGQLVLEESTVKSHVNRIFAKLGLASRVQAVVMAFDSGLVEASGHRQGPST